MAVEQVVPGVYSISLGVVNAFLIDGDEMVLIDTGSPGDAGKIVDAVRGLGRAPQDIRHILVTHCHPDHAGNLAELKEITGAPAYMHPLDAPTVRGDEPGRPAHPAPGLHNRLLFRLFIQPPPWAFERALVEHEIMDEDVLPVCALRALHVPGHSAGQLAFLMPHYGGVLFAADTAANMIRLGLSVSYEDVKCGLRSLAKLSRLRFAVACFGHGGPIAADASARFRKLWGHIDPDKIYDDR